jgi:hypothetical protein
LYCLFFQRFLNGRFLDLYRDFRLMRNGLDDRCLLFFRRNNSRCFWHLDCGLNFGSRLILRWTGFLVHSSDPKGFGSRNTADDNLGSGNILLLIADFNALLGLHSGLFFTVCHEFLLIDTLPFANIISLFS